jgi:hypothetical protein
VKRFIRFALIGSAFATVEEFLTIVVLRRDIPSYVFTLLVVFPAYLSFVYFSSRIIDRLISREPVRDLVHLLIYGSLGLLFEWSIMGLSPWSNPAANPLFMLAFQVGMFAFWTTVSTVPRVFLDRQTPGRFARRRILRFFVLYFTVVYGVGLTVPEHLRFAVVISLIIVGYSVVLGLLFKWVVDRRREPA